jgi:hypothetical protein
MNGQRSTVKSEGETSWQLQSLREFVCLGWSNGKDTSGQEEEFYRLKKGLMQAGLTKRQDKILTCPISRSSPEQGI